MRVMKQCGSSLLSGRPSESNLTAGLIVRRVQGSVYHAPQKDVLGQLSALLASSLGEKRCRMTSRATLTAVPRHIQLHNRAPATSQVVRPSSATPVASISLPHPM
ncbi:hypothetical protein KC338_g129 [Hortaea werneckii]|nr:hypothetical protein KC338_g129 [Hortaea werneckii]